MEEGAAEPCSALRNSHSGLEMSLGEPVSLADCELLGPGMSGSVSSTAVLSNLL